MGDVGKLEKMYAAYTHAVAELHYRPRTKSRTRGSQATSTAMDADLQNQADQLFVDYVDAGGLRKPIHEVSMGYEYAEYAQLRRESTGSRLVELRQLLGYTDASDEFGPVDDRAIYRFKAQHFLLAEEERQYRKDHGGRYPEQVVDQDLWSNIVARTFEATPAGMSEMEVVPIATDGRIPLPLVLRSAQPWELTLENSSTRTVANQHNLALLSLLAYEESADAEQEVRNLYDTTCFREDVLLHQKHGIERAWRPFVHQTTHASELQTVTGEDEARALVIDNPRYTAITFRGREVSSDNLASELERLVSAERKPWTFSRPDEPSFEVNGDLADGFESLADSLRSLLGGNGRKPLFLTGHGIGGAYATLAACYAKSRGSQRGRPVQLYTFAQPRVGDRAFAEHYGSASLPSGWGNFRYFRYAHLYDLLTMVPSLAFADALTSPAEHPAGDTAEVLQRFASHQLKGRQPNLRSLQWSLQAAAGEVGSESVDARLSALQWNDREKREYCHFGVPVLALQDTHGDPHFVEPPDNSPVPDDSSITAVQVLVPPQEESEADQRAWDFAESITTFYPLGAYLSHSVHEFEQSLDLLRNEQAHYPPITVRRAAPVELEVFHHFAHAAAPVLHHGYDRQPGIGPTVELRVEELILTNDGEDSAALDGKWLYAIADGSIAFWVEAKSDSDWVVDGPGAINPGTVANGRIELHSRTSYVFFLSPVAFSEKGQKDLLEQLQECRWTTAVNSPASLRSKGGSVFVRDPFQWALDHHHHQYVPALEAWQKWFYDEERTHKRFVACTLKALIGDGPPFLRDPVDIEDVLRSGEPDGFLDSQREEELKQRQDAEAAAWCIASVIDSPDHRLIEDGYTEQGSDGVSVVLGHFAGVLADLFQTVEGRTLISILAEDARSAPRRHLFTTTPEVELGFAENRFAFNAAVALLKDFAPSLYKGLYPGRVGDAVKHLDGVLARVGIKVDKRTGTTIATSLKQGTVLSSDPPRLEVWNKVERWALQGTVKRHVVGPPSALVTGSRLSDALERNAQYAVVPAAIAIEAINLGIALQSVLDDRQKGQYDVDNLVGALGAVADTGVLLGEAYSNVAEAMGRETGKRLAGSIAALGLVSGVCDAFTFARDASRAAHKYDSNLAVAEGAAAIGAGAIAVGSGLQLFAVLSAEGTATLAGVSLTGIGGVIVAVGAGLVAAGSAIAVWVTDTPMQEFAKMCFLGEKHHGKDVDFDWSPVSFPTRTSKEEVGAMACLLSSFWLKVDGYDSFVLTPGMYNKGDLFEVYAEITYKNRAANHLLMHIDPFHREIRVVRGLRPVLRDQKHAFDIDAFGRTKSIRVSCRDDAEFVQHDGVRIVARLLLKSLSDELAVPPSPPYGRPRGSRPKMPWVEATKLLGVRSEANSLDSDAHVEGAPSFLDSKMKPFSEEK